MQRPFGADGPPVPVHGQGTWEMERAPRAQAVAALRRGMDLGLTHIDTAEMYGSGEAERVVAEAIRGRRDEVFLVSKVLPKNASRTGTVRACEASLKRLGTDHLDVYLLHWAGPNPLADTISAFEELQSRGLIRRYGVSNFDARELEEAVRMAGPGRIACNQVLYHLQERAIEHHVLPACRTHGVALVAYSPFGSGSFPAATSPGGRALARLAAARGATPRQLALAFLARDPSVFTIPKAARVEHVEELAGALTLELADEEIAALDAAFPRGADPGALPTI